MEKRNRYKNRIGGFMILRLFLAGGLVLGAGAGYVYVRNEHVLCGNEIGLVERQIGSLDQEIELWELRIAAVRDRHELSRRLRWVQSDLADIDLSKVIEIQSVSPSGAPVASAY
ncbi:MAG: hypothetical protein B9S36_03965 [Verrucomicrobiia bacterium Tous-C2TDCM]|jgi:hypothetical protein|nr:MAG: hypothetical protein B9S36_03965 [Verrucomicrobiae bacterium Tous-C2TDCM]